MKSSLALLILLFFTNFAQAEYVADLNIFYFNDSLVEEDTSSQARTFWATSIVFGVGKSKSFLAGWNINSVTANDSATEDDKFSSLDMGPKFTWLFKKDKTMSASVAYNLSSKASYTNGSAEEAKWSGTSILADIAFMPALTESLNIGIKLNYYKSTATQSVVGSTTYSEVSYSRGWIFPTVHLTFFY